MIISVKNTFERRIGIWPAGFDSDGVMYCNTAFGDYPHYVRPPKSPGGGLSNTQPSLKQNVNISGTSKSGISAQVTPPPGEPEGAAFTGWMLLNYNKPVQVSSTLGGDAANNAVDEMIKTYWSATSGNNGEWIQTDLGAVSTVHAIQINYADQDVDSSFLGKSSGVYHQYKLHYSTDGKKWTVLIDKSKNKTDVPHDYVALEKPVQARYIKLENIHMPTGKFAISGLRVFGNGNGTRPDSVKTFVVLGTEKDKRSAYIKWSPVDNAYAYNIYYGTEPGKLYNCFMVYSNNEYWFKAMDLKKPYYFTIEAINENGVSAMTKILKVD
jgi:hypothetical protein